MRQASYTVATCQITDPYLYRDIWRCLSMYGTSVVEISIDIDMHVPL